MTKDFKKQAAADSTFGQFGMGWMAGGIALGLLIGAGMYALANKGNPPDTAATAPQTLASNTPLTAPVDAGNPATTTQPGTAASTQDVAAPAGETGQETPGFSYHAVLPQLEVDVPVSVQVEQQAAADKRAEDKQADKPKPGADKQEKPAKAEPEAKPAEAAPAPAEAPAIQPIPTGFNGFQIGSYKTEGQATDMQGRLKRGGLNSRIEQANVKGEVWFRVRLGPATSPDMMQKWQQTLSGMGISPLAVRM